MSPDPRNVSNPAEDNEFFFKIKDDAYLAYSHNQEELAKEFKEGCLKDITKPAQDFYNSFSNENTKNLSSYENLDDNIFILEGVKVKLFYDFAATDSGEDGEHWLGFKRVVEDGEEDKEYALLFTRYQKPELELSLNVKFKNVKNESGETVDKTITLKALNFKPCENNNTNLAIAMKKGGDLKYDFIKQQITTPIIMIVRNNVLMMSISSIVAKSIKDKINSWTGMNINKQEAEQAMEKLPYYLANTMNIDDIDDKTAGKTGMFNSGDPSTRFYFKIKNS